MPTTFPSSASFEHPLSSARELPREDTRCRCRTDRGPRSDDTPRSVPPSRRPGCFGPSRHAKEFVSHRGRSTFVVLPAFAPALPLTPPTRLPVKGSVLLMGIASSRCGHPRDVTGSSETEPRECGRLFDSLGLPRLDLTTQARHRARPTRPSTRTDCLARTDVGRSA